MNIENKPKSLSFSVYGFFPIYAVLVVTNIKQKKVLILLSTCTTSPQKPTIPTIVIEVEKKYKIC